jgi:acyl dehydratase
MSSGERVVPVSGTLPELSVAVDAVHIFMFSAVTWNRHLIHYDKDQAGREGHSSVVAQRGLLGNYFARQVTAWLGDGGRMTSLSWTVKRSVVPGDVITCRGNVVAADGPAISVALEMSNQDGTVVATGAADAHLGDR